MPQMVYRVIGLEAQANREGVEMCLMRLCAVEGEAFEPSSQERPEAKRNSPHVPAYGDIRQLVTWAFVKAKGLQVRDTVTINMQEQ